MITNFKIALFAYNFPHRKTLDFISILSNSNFKISLILAANFVPIDSPKSHFNLFKKEIDVLPKDLAKKYKIPYYVVPHNSEQTKKLLKEYNIDFGIIGGARILKKSIIDIFKFGILNFHPGLLPMIRGLDSILWSIYKDFSIGVTAHLITDKIDSGELVVQKKINISYDDDIAKLYEKNYQLQLDLIPISLNLISENKSFKTLKNDGNYNSKMSYETQLELNTMIGNYINRHSKR